MKACIGKYSLRKIVQVSLGSLLAISSTLLAKTPPHHTVLLYKSVVIKHSLKQAEKAAGLTPLMDQQLNHLLKNALIPGQTVHPGDHVRLIYREYSRPGKKNLPLDIAAASFTHRGKTHYAVEYAYPKAHPAYYSPTGNRINHHAAFLSAPVAYKYISSRFSYHRLDPYIHTWRAHLGVDYAAEPGTPVKAVADGKVIFAGRDQGYGNAVIIRFNDRYKALYGHLWHFAKHLHANEYVHKGEVIGYVGSTGWSTGPHLHFGFFVNGTARNFLSLHLAGNSDNIPYHYRPQYLHYAHHLLAALRMHQTRPLSSY